MPEKKPSAMTQKIEVAVAKKLAEKKPPNLSLLRRSVGALFLAVWAAFLIAEYFGVVVHPEAFALEHLLTKWSPLFVGLILLAPDALDQLLGLLKTFRIVKRP